ncbi:MAG: hypothetical protein DI629_16895 [Mesorhizobium amorphae]|nr:MAG: hypothetical protein DI629_16895 [Mesorhizobium amorphae]
MRWLLILWGGPLVLFWGWYFISLNDWHFGFVLLTREAHDLIFQVYASAVGDLTQQYLGQRLEIDPAALPGMLARTFFYDSLLLGALLAFRRRKSIAAWVRARYAGAEPSAPSA